MLFETYIPPGSAILDLGVGGGRTTSYLANRASRYVGVDYAAAMVKACQAKFPDLEFVVADAANLSIFPDASFDVVVFAFNGIDYVLPEQSRRSCFEHIRRVLKAKGVLIFSSHNARAVLIRPQWNRERLQRTARRFSADSKNAVLATGWRFSRQRGRHWPSDRRRARLCCASSREFPRACSGAARGVWSIPPMEGC